MLKDVNGNSHQQTKWNEMMHFSRSITMHGEQTRVTRRVNQEKCCKSLWMSTKEKLKKLWVFTFVSATRETSDRPFTNRTYFIMGYTGQVSWCWTRTISKRHRQGIVVLDTTAWLILRSRRWARAVKKQTLPWNREKAIIIRWLPTTWARVLSRKLSLAFCSTLTNLSQTFQ